MYVYLIFTLIFGLEIPLPVFMCQNVKNIARMSRILPGEQFESVAAMLRLLLGCFYLKTAENFSAFLKCMLSESL